jgi:3-oxoadipate enol-lactonase
VKIDVNGTTIAVIDEGQGDAVLFLHGMGCDGTDWAPQITALSGQYRCIAIDHRGHGESDRVVGDGFSISGFAADVLGVLDHLGVSAAHVVGLSMGGMVSQRIALDAPERVLTLTLLDTFARPGPLGESMGAMAEEIEKGDLDAFAAGFQAMMFASLTTTTKPEVIERFQAQFRANTPACLAWDIRAAASFDVLEDLGGIRAPTLVCCGAEDNLTPPNQAEEIAAAIPGARLEIIPDAGHFSNIENAPLVNELLAKHFATEA